MNKNKSNKLKGIVVALKANFLIVEIDFKVESMDQFHESETSIHESKLDYKGLFIDVGDIVFLESIDYKNKRAVIYEVEPRKFFKTSSRCKRYLSFYLYFSWRACLVMEQASRFLLTAECANIKPLLILTKIDLISNNDLIIYINKLKSWGYNCIPVSILILRVLPH